ncbi:GNAT family N-acetyltransferase [Mariniflexile ostreae]|uniref:GNAT family N-acetyltransferase n=1 Tax=Mariniflexile ostreae TaxID=1520892 RepID=A0ABV5FES1_9FLAO
MAYTIKPIDAKDTHAVRHPILRAGMPLEACIFPGDTLATTIHLGVFLKKEVIGVGSFLKNKHSAFPENKQYQLRGMAILKAFQKKHLGKMLLEYAENKLRETDAQILWCHAREDAIAFYKKNGFTPLGDPFFIQSAGIHLVMYKYL